MTNIYKPRYKICYQTKNKVWIYKNSRLRHFYNLRARIILRRNWTHRKIMVAKNMKWTVARRFMIPYSKKRLNFSYNYKNVLYLKQQVKNFYGKLKEYQLRNIFKNSWNKEQYFKRNVFISSLEQRLDMVLYRMRLLPTIYSCHQLINHQGILVNKVSINIPGYKVKVGDIVSVPKNIWPIFYNMLYYKFKKRLFGQNIVVWRRELLLNKVEKSLTFKKNYFKHNLFFIKQFEKNRALFKLYFKYINNKYIWLSNNNIKSNKNLFFYYKELYYFLFPINHNIKLMRSKLKRLNSWNKPDYFYLYNWLLVQNFFVSKVNAWLTWRLKKQILKLLFNEFDIKASTFTKDKDKILLLFISLNNLYNISYKKKKSNLYKNFLKFLIIKYKYVFKLNLNSNIWNRKSLSNFYNVRLLRYINNQKIRRAVFKHKSWKHHWYVPNYLEVDYKTLRSSFLYHPHNDEVVYGFPCSFDKIISFYKERAL